MPLQSVQVHPPGLGDFLGGRARRWRCQALPYQSVMYAGPDQGIVLAAGPSTRTPPSGPPHPVRAAASMAHGSDRPIRIPAPSVRLVVTGQEHRGRVE